jgi:hypothetical protein
MVPLQLKALFLLAGASLLAVSGCAPPPRNAPWRADEKVIQPMDGDGKQSGSLVVETVFLGNDNGVELRQPFFLYDELGQYLTHHPNRTMSPVSLAAGRYVVVTSILHTNKRIQVVIKDGQRTYVRLNDFKSAPEAE